MSPETLSSYVHRPAWHAAGAAGSRGGAPPANNSGREFGYFPIPERTMRENGTPTSALSGCSNLKTLSAKRWTAQLADD